MVALEEAAWNAPAPRRPEEGGDPDIGEQEEVEGGHEASVLPRLGPQGGPEAPFPADRVRRLDSLLCGQVLMEATSLGSVYDFMISRRTAVLKPTSQRCPLLDLLAYVTHSQKAAQVTQSLTPKTLTTQDWVSGDTRSRAWFCSSLTGRP
ncbi:unnamed protein product [Rangifer tarandus platyrhynchus]|uniref:Uncharacterized protein n=1 Tax=Rangifer tarandus platyrhynchus TaxID=3082113 RepID=A0AC59YXI7_RANTA